MRKPKSKTRQNLLFPGLKSAYSNKHVFASWSSYSFVKASYTCPKPGKWSTAMLHTSEPIGDVYFAGKHWSVDYQGFMNGAAETGRFASDKIIEKLKKIIIALIIVGLKIKKIYLKAKNTLFYVIKHVFIQNNGANSKKMNCEYCKI